MREEQEEMGEEEMGEEGEEDMGEKVEEMMDGLPRGKLPSLELINYQGEIHCQADGKYKFN